MRIWTGRAGSGKTTAILREIAALSEKGEGRQILRCLLYTSFGAPIPVYRMIFYG